MVHLRVTFETILIRTTRFQEKEIKDKFEAHSLFLSCKASQQMEALAQKLAEIALDK